MIKARKIIPIYGFTSEKTCSNVYAIIDTHTCTYKHCTYKSTNI